MDVTVVVKGDVAFGNVSATAEVGGVTGPGANARNSGPPFPCARPIPEAKTSTPTPDTGTMPGPPTVCQGKSLTVPVPPGVNFRISPVVAKGTSATKRLPALSKANPRGSSLSPVAKVVSVPSGANLRIAPSLGTLSALDAKRLPDPSKARPTGV